MFRGQAHVARTTFCFYHISRAGEIALVFEKRVAISAQLREDAFLHKAGESR